MIGRHDPAVPIDVWGGVECTVNRVGDKWFDQVVRSGHQHRLDDLDRFAALGVRVLRYPVLWERMAPDRADVIDWRWTDQRLTRLRQLGIQPIVGLLHHGSGPAYTSLVDERFPEQFAAFAAAVARRYPWVTAYTPINEPLTTARFSGLYGHWYPHGRDARTFVRAMLTQMRGIVLAMRAIRAITPAATLIQTEDCGRTFGTAGTSAQVAHEAERRWLTWDLLAGRVDAAHPLWQWLTACGASAEALEFFSDRPCPPDVLGLNYYVTSDRHLDERLARYPAWLHGGNGESAYADVEAVRSRDEGIVGHERHLMDAWTRYRTPVAITEVHLACSREEQVRWLVDSWQGAHRARARGADVKAVTAWALLGSFDWDSLVTRDAGHYEPGVFDLRAPLPRPTALAATVRTLAAGGSFTHAVLDVRGWWQRPERIVYRDAAVSARSVGHGRPVVVVGASPAAADALQKACAVRGLGLRLVNRHDYDLTNPAAADAMLRKLDPWAVLDMTSDGYPAAPVTRRPASKPPVVMEHLNLAAACRRRAMTLATWSSGDVFDGGDEQGYAEDDAVAPLSAAAIRLADTERRIRDVMPDSLVIRTGLVFGPRETLPLERLSQGAAGWSFPAQELSGTVSYMPHVVDVLLDLLIDQESGVWHLVNAATQEPVARSTDDVQGPDGDEGGVACRGGACTSRGRAAAQRARLADAIARARARRLCARRARRIPDRRVGDVRVALRLFEELHRSVQPRTRRPCRGGAFAIGTTITGSYHPRPGGEPTTARVMPRRRASRRWRAWGPWWHPSSSTTSVPEPPASADCPQSPPPPATR